MTCVCFLPFIYQHNILLCSDFLFHVDYRTSLFLLIHSYYQFVLYEKSHSYNYQSVEKKQTKKKEISEKFNTFLSFLLLLLLLFLILFMYVLLNGDFVYSYCLLFLSFVFFTLFFPSISFADHVSVCVCILLFCFCVCHLFSFSLC